MVANLWGKDSIGFNGDGQGDDNFEVCQFGLFLRHGALETE